MNPVLFPASERYFTSNGLGRLAEATSCTVSEELNGAFELTLEYPAGGRHSAELLERNLILAPHDDTLQLQPFRIYQRSEDLMGNLVIRARHVSGDLSRIPVMPYTADSLAGALAGLRSNAAVPCPFTFSADFISTDAYALAVPASAKAVLGGQEASIMGVYGGDVRYDLWEVSLLSRRGIDTDITIRYGKNMTALEAVRTRGEAFHAVVPYCIGQDDVLVTLPEQVVSNGLPYSEAVPLDLSDQFDYVPAPAQLRAAAEAWLNEHRPWVSVGAYNVSFVDLAQTEEYKALLPLQKLSLGDSVRVQHPELGIDERFRVVRTDFDVLAGRYAQITLGRPEDSVATVLQETVRELSAKIDKAQQMARDIANGTYNGGTFLNDNLIYAPNIYGGTISIGQRQGGGYNFTVDSYGNIRTAGGMTAVGHYETRENDIIQDDQVIPGPVTGAMGRAYGNDGKSMTWGVALCEAAANPESLQSSNNYVIITNAGARMQAKGHSIYIISSGAFYDGKEILTEVALDELWDAVNILTVDVNLLKADVASIQGEIAALWAAVHSLQPTQEGS